MSAIVPKESLEHLVVLGRSRGHLTTDDLARTLPVHTMEPDDIALVVVHLEDAGVSAELDESLLASNPQMRRKPVEAQFRLVNDQPDQIPKPPASPTDLRGTSTAAPPDRMHAAVPSTQWPVVVAGVLVLALLTGLLLSFT